MRQEAIFNVLLRENHATVRALADRFKVSPMTIYRDLQDLESRQLIIRTVGGAMIRPNTQFGKRWSERNGPQSSIKQKLGLATAALLQAGQTVIFDAGTTILEVARHVPPDMSLTAVTNSLPTAAVLGEMEQVRVLIPGGQYNPTTGSILGIFSTTFLKQINADICLLSTASMHIEQGLGNFSMESVAVKRTMIARSKKVILVGDYSKFQQTALLTVAPIDAVHVVVTDDRMPQKEHERLDQMGIQTITVPYSSSESTDWSPVDALL